MKLELLLHVISKDSAVSVRTIKVYGETDVRV